MSTVVCEVTLPEVHARPQPGRYHWPSFSSLRSSSSSKFRPSALRVVSSDALPTTVQQSAVVSAGPCAPGQGVRASSVFPSRDASSATADGAEAVREQDRMPEPSSSPVKPRTHVRAKSTTAVGEPSRLDSPSAQTTPSHPQYLTRPRAASSAAIDVRSHSRQCPRLPSMLSSVLTNPRAPVQTRMASRESSELVGSFTPTSSPRQSLLNLLTVGGTVKSPTPSSPRSRRAPLHLLLGGSERRSSDEHKPSPASSPIDSPSATIPSISRTPSSYSGSEYFPTAPSSAGPPTPVHSAPTLPVARKSESLHPVLANIERTSLLNVKTSCATCGKRGSNFPCCPKCGELWCSRPCRLKKGNGKRHVCSKRV
ncbi:hypothetical protein BD414DRAFT_494079 [Trametes punicea]|nr:hypothetical protein BD414DRAFT_494079 [Trametes punicea]